MTAVVLLTGGLQSGLPAQSLAQRLAGAPDGQVVFAFAARAGVCGNGKGWIRDGRHFIPSSG